MTLKSCKSSKIKTSPVYIVIYNNIFDLINLNLLASGWNKPS